MIDFESSSTELLLNPRLPDRERERLERIRAAMPSLPGHVWMTTSGTSGPLKLVALGKSAILASARAVNAHLRATNEDVWFCALPTFHVGGLGILARAFSNGAAVVELPSWNAAELLAAIRRKRLTLGALVPAQISDLVNAGVECPDGLRAIVVGGGELDPSLLSAARALGWPLLPSYGMTETCSQVATASLDSVGEAGFPDLELLDHLEAMVVGDRLAFRGESILTGYCTEQDGAAAFVDPKQDGWFFTEDRGRVEHGGNRTWIRPLGRGRDFVKIGGESVSLARLDAILADLLGGFPGIDAAVVAVPDERLGSVIHLAVSSITEAETLRQAWDARVLPFERAREVHVTAIPRSPLGKLRRREILQEIDRSC